MSACAEVTHCHLLLQAAAVLVAIHGLMRAVVPQVV